MKRIINQFLSFKMEKSWMWLFYLDALLPLFLFVLAFSLGKTGLGPTLARLFHSYNLYVISPLPDLGSLTGILGVIIHAGAIIYALKKKDLKDAAVSLLISLLAFLYFYFELNYSLALILNFSA